MCTYDERTGRLVKLRKRSWDGHSWDTLTYADGLIQGRIRTAPGRYEVHYRFDPATNRLRQIAAYSWRNGKKVQTWPK